jgi:hypothetical protein
VKKLKELSMGKVKWYKVMSYACGRLYFPNTAALFIPALLT